MKAQSHQPAPAGGTTVAASPVAPVAPVGAVGGRSGGIGGVGGASVTDARPRFTLGRGAWLDAAFFALLAAVVGVFFRQVILGEKVFFFRDLWLAFYPRRELAATAVRHFRLPLWDSLSGGGLPVIGSYQVGFFYPFALIYYLFEMPRSFSVFIVVHFLITGAGMYLMLRAWGTRRLAAGAGGLAWAFAPSFVSIVDYVSFFTALSWMPWCLAFAKMTLDRGTFAPVAGLVFSFSMALLAACPEPVILITVLIVILAAWRRVGDIMLAARLSRSRHGKPSRHPSHGARGRGGVTAAVAAAFLVSSVALVPFFYHLTNSERGAKLSMKEAAKSSMSPTDAGRFILPRFNSFPSIGGIHWTAGQHWIKSTYLGALISILALWTLVAVRRRRNRYFAAVGVLFFLMALGGSSPLWRTAYDTIPGVSMIRFPAKFFMPAALAAVTLAAFALDDILVTLRAAMPTGRAGGTGGTGGARGAWLRGAWLRGLLSGRVRGAAGLYLLAGMLAAGACACLVLYYAVKADPGYYLTNILSVKDGVSAEEARATAAMRLDASVWSLGRSGIVLLISAAAAFLLALLRKRRRAAVAFVAVLAVVAAADVTLLARPLNPMTAPDFYAPPSHLADIETGPGAGRLWVCEELMPKLDNLRVDTFAPSVEALCDRLAVIKGPAFADPAVCLGWSRWAAGEDFADLAAVDKYLKSGPALEFREALQYEFHKESFCPDTHLLWGASSVLAFEVLKVKWSAALLLAMRDPRHLNEEGVRRLFAVSRVREQGGTDLPLFYRRVERPTPRAFLISKVSPAAADDSALARVAAKGFDPTAEVVLLERDAAEANAFLAGGPSGAAPPGASNSVSWLSDTGNRQRLDVDSPAPALLYVADNYYPLIRARVDGRPAPLYRANYAFRAVPVAAGRHRVEFYYLPLDLYAGLAATLLGLAAFAAFFFKWPVIQARLARSAIFRFVP